MARLTNPTPWEAALAAGNFETVKEFLVQGFDANALTEHGLHPLCEAVATRNIDLCKLLIDYGAEVNPELGVGAASSPLHEAIMHRSEMMVEYLLSVGAYPEFVPAKPLADYVTPFQYAVAQGDVGIVAILAERAEVDFDQTTPDGRTLEQLASTNAEMTQFLDALKAERSVEPAPRSTGDMSPW